MSPRPRGLLEPSTAVFAAEQDHGPPTSRRIFFGAVGDVVYTRRKKTGGGARVLYRRFLPVACVLCDV
jgi:hypothetical protein